MLAWSSFERFFPRYDCSAMRVGIIHGTINREKMTLSGKRSILEEERKRGK